MKELKQRLIIFDLDETLLHATRERLQGREEHARYKEYYLYKRPYLDELLVECSKSYRLAIWSSAIDKYVQGIVKEVIPDTIQLEFVWSRSDCWIKVGRGEDQHGLSIKKYLYIKSLEKVRRKGYLLDHLLIIDDSSHKVKDNTGKFLIINPFKGDPDDRELESLAAYLRHLSGQTTFSSVRNDSWREDY